MFVGLLGVSSECGAVFSLWREAVLSFSVDDVACDAVATKLVISAAVNITTDVGCALLRKIGGDVDSLVSAVGPGCYTPQINTPCAKYWVGDVNRFPRT